MFSHSLLAMVCVRGAHRFLVNPSSGGSQPPGRISTKLFLSRSTVTVPSWGCGFLFMTCRACNLQKNYYWYMQKLDPLQAHDLHDYRRTLWWRMIAPPPPFLRWCWPLITSTSIYNVWHAIINGAEWSTKDSCREEWVPGPVPSSLVSWRHCKTSNCDIKAYVQHPYFKV